MYICLTSALRLTSREGDRLWEEVPQREEMEVPTNEGRSPHKWRNELLKEHNKAPKKGLFVSDCLCAHRPQQTWRSCTPLHAPKMFIASLQWFASLCIN